MEKVLRLLMIYICVPIYSIIPKAYDLFYSLASQRFFSDERIDQFSSNIYVLTCVVMLFAFSANLLAAIVNPDLMDDKKKGVGAMFKRALLGIMLIVLVPFAFDEAYSIQENILDNSLIEKIIIGISWDEGEEGTGGGNGGQVIAGTLMASVLYPAEDASGTNVAVEGEEGEKATKYYNKMISENITALSKFAKHINIEAIDGNTSDDVELTDSDGNEIEYAFEFQSLVAVVGGVVCIYILVMYSIDMAVRSVKLGLLELIAPISIISYIAGGTDILKRWAQETGKTFLDVFIRIAIMAFYIYAIYVFGQDDILGDLGWFAKVIMVVGMLIFVKQLPDLIGKVFGIQVESKGGIGGRLGQMAGVGKIAQDGWGKVTKGLGTAALTVGGVGAAAAALGVPGALAAGAGVGLANRAWNKGIGNGKALKDTTFGHGLRRTGAYLSGGNPISGIKKQNELDFVKERNEEKDYERKDKRNQALKADAKSKAQSSANKVVGNLYDNNGNLDTAIARTVTPAGYKDMLKMGGLSQMQVNKVSDFNEKRDNKRQIDNQQAAYNRIQSNLSRALSASSNDADKRKILDLTTKFDSGNISYSGLYNELMSVSSLQDSSGHLSEIGNAIMTDVLSIRNGNNNTYSSIELSNMVECASKSYDTAKESYDGMLNSISSDSEKELIKAFNKMGNDIGKIK